MRSDALLNLVTPGVGLSLVGSPGVSPASAVIDLIGQGVGQPPGNIIGTATTFATDFGIGDDRPLLDIVIGTALATSNGATLNVAFQGAPDTGAGGGYLPGTWQTFVESGPLTAAQCTAGQIIARFDWPPAFPSGNLPRYVRLLFQVPSGENFTAGSIAFAIVTSARDDQANRYAAKNYKVL